MADSNENLPATRMGLGVPADIPTDGLPLTLRIMLDDRMYEKLKVAAGLMAKSEGFVGKHLIGKPEACFAILTRSMEWRLDPFFVGQATYQTPGGQVGFEGKLCQAILENSGRIIGGVRFEHYGDWGRLVGKFEIVKGSTGRDYAKPTWTKKDAEGLGVTVIAQVRGEAEPRRWSIDLVQAWPLNSPLWATDPRSQICYLAVRRFGDLAAPGIYGGVRFNVDEYLDASEAARDVTPPLQMAETPTPSRETRAVVDADRQEDGGTMVWDVIDAEGEVLASLRSAEAFVEAVGLVFEDAAKRGFDALEAAYENNTDIIAAMQSDGYAPALALGTRYDELRRSLTEETKVAQPVAQATQTPHQQAPTAQPQPPERGRHRSARAPAAQEGLALQGEPAASQQPATAQQQTDPQQQPDPEPQPDAPPTQVPDEEASPFWRTNLIVALPRRPQGGHNWPAFADEITQLISQAPAPTSIDAFRVANKRALDDLKTYYSGGFTEFEQVAAARVEQLRGGVRANG